MSNGTHKLRALLGRIIADVWKDVELLQELQRAPGRVFAQYGLHPPPQVAVSIWVDTDTTRHVIADPGWVHRHGADFMQRLASAPEQALASTGYPVMPGVEYKVLFNTATQMNIVIPVRPSVYECSVEKVR